jgi:hypothetical protein
MARALEVRGKTDRIGIGAAQQHAHALALQLLAQRSEQRCGGGRAGWLHGQLQLCEQDQHGRAQLIVGDGHELVDMAAA